MEQIPQPVVEGKTTWYLNLWVWWITLAVLEEVLVRLGSPRVTPSGVLQQFTLISHIAGFIKMLVPIQLGWIPLLIPSWAIFLLGAFRTFFILPAAALFVFGIIKSTRIANKKQLSHGSRILFNLAVLLVLTFLVDLIIFWRPASLIFAITGHPPTLTD